MTLIVLEGIDGCGKSTFLRGGPAPSRSALHPHGLGRHSPAALAFPAALRAIVAGKCASVARLAGAHLPAAGGLSS